ncbi:L,D-transpeptidase [Bifidobacterium sp. CP2]|uniref:L,D-transpeptidase n=1 Tax=Bifidobacterium sp. CP2 TaxID=2809025 RepID=UPI001BDBE7B8|nr:L,D-transpeptidase [Bifidobacterium sp. CP2]MBT1181940.1 L,D-transpeptidase [Bifidobacterium sp. CP2]
MAARHSQRYVGQHRKRTDVMVVAQAALCAVLAVLMCAMFVLWQARAAERDEALAGIEAAKTAKIVQAKAKAEATKTLKRDKVPAFNQTIQEQRERDRWTNPTGGQQPNLADYTDLSVDVSLAEQKVYVKSAGNTIYTMIASTGMDDSTPHGTYVISARGTHFYNPDERMGADYWVRFKGPYLFHSVPTGVNAGDYLTDEAAKLGRPASHGCVRLSIADAKWFYDQMPAGTPVTIA